LTVSEYVYRLVPQIEQYQRKINVPDYETKVPENVRTINAEKLLASETELATTKQAIDAFLKLKV
jgi:valyl-tRNA synthetase